MALSEGTLQKLERIKGWKELPDAERQEIVDALASGVKNLGQFFAFTPEMFNAVEAMAYNYYRSKVYLTSSQLYSYLLTLDPERPTAWRGLGACFHANKNYSVAVNCYAFAVRFDPDDVISQVYWGECLCLGDDPKRGLEILTDVVKHADAGKVEATLAPFVARARAIVAAKGGIPQRIVLMDTGRMIAEDAAAALKEQGIDPGDPLEGMFQSPEAQAMLEEIAEGYRNHLVTIREIAGFSAEQMDAAFAGACQYLNTGQPTQALQIIGWLIYIDSKDPRFYHLGGICMQHLKVYPMADYMYDMARLYGNDADPTTLVYHGEVKILQEEREEGLALVRQAIELAKKDPTAHDVIKRGQVLLKQFGG